MLTLRNYQAEAVLQAQTLFRSGRKSVLYVLPTGGGKTPVLSELASRAARKRKNVVIFVHRRHLLSQTRAHLKALGCVGVEVATVQDANTVSLAKWADLIIFDEAHHIEAATWREIADANPKAVTFGTTATPFRTDGKGLGGVFEAAIEGPSILDLINLGFLVPPEIWRPKSGEPSGDPVKTWLRRAKGLTTLSFCSSVGEAKKLSHIYNAAGIPADCIHGATSETKRTRILNALNNREIKVVTSCDTISEGLDVPTVECVQLLRATKSKMLYYQQIGRGLRIAPNKDKAIVLDHFNNCEKLGDPLEGFEWSLYAGAGGRVRDDSTRSTPRLNSSSIYSRSSLDDLTNGYLVRLKPAEAVSEALAIIKNKYNFAGNWDKTLNDIAWAVRSGRLKGETLDALKKQSGPILNRFITELEINVTN